MRMEARVLHIETPETFHTAVDAAVNLLRSGEVAALPTETVYGLAANAFDERAVAKIYEVKGRPAINPVIVHIASQEMARACVADWPPSAAVLARRFWPGPLTLVLRKSERIPAIVTAGGPTVGLRWPLHPFMQETIRRCGFPLAAPSANLANQLSPTSADHVRASLGSRIPLIVDAGSANVGIESTVLDLTVDPPRLLRPGMVLRHEIEETLGCRIQEHTPGTGALKSPGMMKRHYSPRAKLVIRSWRNDAELLDRVRATGFAPADAHVLAHDQVPRGNAFARVSVIPQDAEAYARALYQELHRCDELAAKLIVVESVPEGGAWNAIRDRLIRASADQETT